MTSLIYVSENNKVRVIDLNQEYNGYYNETLYVIVTDLLEVCLRRAYPHVVKQYCPFVILTEEMYEAMNDSHMNDHRERMRDLYLHDEYSLDAAICMVDEFSNPVRICESLYTMDCIFRKLRTLPNGAGANIYMKFVIGYSIAEIAEMKGVKYQEVQKSIYRALSKLHDIFVEMGVVA